MLPLIIHENAHSDLLNLKKKFEEASGGERRDLKCTLGRILAVIEQMKADETLQERLTVHDNEQDGLNIQKWCEQQGLGNNLWRIKMWSTGTLLKYRIIYAYEQISNFNHQAKFHILAIVDRNEFDYESEHDNPISARIISDYRNL